MTAPEVATRRTSSRVQWRPVSSSCCCRYSHPHCPMDALLLEGLGSGRRGTGPCSRRPRRGLRGWARLSIRPPSNGEGDEPNRALASPQCPTLSHVPIPSSGTRADIRPYVVGRVLRACTSISVVRRRRHNGYNGRDALDTLARQQRTLPATLRRPGPVQGRMGNEFDRL